MSPTWTPADDHLLWITQPASITAIQETVSVYCEPNANLNARHWKAPPMEVFAGEGMDKLLRNGCQDLNV